MMEDILEFNRRFVEDRQYEKYVTSKYPDRKIAVVTCMDTRLVELVPAALGFKNGDIKMIKNAGGVVTEPFGSAVRSILVGIYELGIEDVLIIGHSDCGAQHISGEELLSMMRERGISQEDIDMCRFFDVDFDRWLCGFDSVEESVRSSVGLLESHPLIPDDVRIWGFVIDSHTGELKPVV
ncbi:MAG: carbonic anhydrase [Candidatus Methanomethylophilaceae archaeon]|nr:carbonic anhydrase [Candidatus Methanomethylophilaceae archaeon]MBQ7406028.1 carbonic anhydrase [Candidatus Methanomethylophilaceae archaeon]MBR2348000.1 carbonic anhydrase [Candidatus Methanomethylophilaceae archaeon]